MTTAQSQFHTTEQANFRHLVMETMWFGIAVVTTQQYLSVFAIRLGATPTQLALLDSLPALVLLASSWLSHWWRKRSVDCADAIFWPSLWRRFTFLMLAFTPLLPREWQIWWLIFSISLPAIPQSIAAVLNNVLWREAVGDNRLTDLVSRRSMAVNAATAVSGLAFGLWLERAPFPANYQIMFVVAFGLVMISLWHIRQIKIIAPQEAFLPDTARVQPWRSAGFRRVALAAAITYIAYYAVQPLIPLRLVNELGAGESYMAIYGLVRLGAAVAMAMFTGQIVRFMGNRTMMAVAMIGLGLQVFTLAITNDLYVALLMSALSGAAWTMIGIGLYGILAESIPAETRYATAFQQTTYFATFVGPLIGSQLAGLEINLITIMLIGALIRLAAGALLQFDARKG